MVDSVVQLPIVVDLVLPVLVPAPGCEPYRRFFVLEWGSIFKKSVDDQGCLHSFVLILVEVRDRAVEWRQDDGLFRFIAQSLVDGVQVELGEAVPWLHFIVDLFRSVQLPWIVVDKFSLHNVFFLLVEDLTWVLGELQPWMSQDLLDGDSPFGVCFEHRSHQGLGIVCYLFLQVVLAFDDHLVQFFHVAGFEGDSATKHGVQYYASAPDISFESHVPLLLENFRSDVGWRPTLFPHYITRLDELADSKISNFHVTFTIKQDVVELDVSVKNALSVDVAKALDDLPEDHFCNVFVQLLPLSDVVEEVTTSAQLHRQQHVPLCLEGLVQFHDALVPEPQQYPNLVHDLRFLFLISHEFLVDALQSDQLPRQLVHTQTYFSKGSSSKHFASSVEVRSGLWCISLLQEGLPDQARNLHHLSGSRREGRVCVPQAVTT